MLTMLSRYDNGDEELKRASEILKAHGIEVETVAFHDSRATLWWSTDDIQTDWIDGVPDSERLDILLENEAQILTACTIAGNEKIASLLEARENEEGD